MRRGPELYGVYQDEVERAIHEDAFECAWRAGLYKFGRLSNRRIVALVRSAALSQGFGLGASDAELLDRWFGIYSAYFHSLRNRRLSRLERTAS
jgi:hypothetical protein